MTAKKPVLSDHRKVKSKLITPFNDALGPMRNVSWINTMIPELVWIAMLEDRFGSHRCAQLLTDFTRELRLARPDLEEEIMAAAGKFSSLRVLPSADIQTGTSDMLRLALQPLACLYPSFPLKSLFEDEPVPTDGDLALVRAVVERLYDRGSRFATMVQAHAIWLAFDSGRFKVSPNVSLAEFPKIDEYPSSEISRKIAASIRATLNSSFGDGGMLASGTQWPVEFWNRGLELEPCEFLGD